MDGIFFNCMVVASASTMVSLQFDTPLWIWSMSTAISFICFVICTWIFCRERQKRQQQDHLTVSKYLSMSSYLCIILGAITTCFHILSYIPVLCITRDILITPIVTLQISTMECYQLSRLYYCFSRKQVHSNNGYPNWVFVILCSLTVIWYPIAVLWDYQLVSLQCQIASDGTAVIQYTEPFGYDSGSWMIIVLFCRGILYGVIESTTAALYWYKINSLKRHEDEKDRAVYDRIQSILHRVLILTFFYLLIDTIMVLLDWTGSSAAATWPFSIMSLSLSYSMYLMQDHNTRAYSKFIRILHRCKVHLCCCFCHRMLSREYKALKAGHLDIGGQRNDDIDTTMGQFSLDIVPSRQHQTAVNSGSLTEMVGEKSPEVLRGRQRQLRINDFLYDEAQTKSHGISRAFDFGVYLDYWKGGHRNTVIPMHDTLREELTQNLYKTISLEQYDELEAKCRAILKRHTFTAKDIGVMNEICGIPVGSAMSIEHAICLKFYTDFDEEQRVFKRHCRRIYKGEGIESVAARNSEVAHWCRRCVSVHLVTFHSFCPIIKPLDICICPLHLIANHQMYTDI